MASRSAGRRANRAFPALAGSATALLLAVPAATSAPGDLDAGFGSRGKVRTDFGSRGDDIARAIVIRPDGTVVAVGSTTSAPHSIPPSTPRDFALARYRANGTLDRRFGGDGKVTVDLASSEDDIGQAAALQPDQKIVVAGVTGHPDAVGEQDFALARLNDDGSLDRSFGEDGRVVTDVGPAQDADWAFAVAVQRNRKVVAVGQSDVDRTFALVRYNTDGTLDERFGSGGKVVTKLTARGRGAARAVTIQRDGKIVIGGRGPSGFTLARYTQNGRLDRTFGRRGLVLSNLGLVRDGQARALAVQGDGKILAAGWGEILVKGCCAPRYVVLARYRADGRLDRTFGRGGKVVTLAGDGISDPGGYAMARQADGKIVVAGGIGGGGDDFMLARYTASGAPDTTFGGTGVVITDFGSRLDYARTVGIDPRGRIITAGGSATLSSDVEVVRSDFALARYQSRGERGTEYPSLSATRANSGVLVRWRTSREVGVKGFVVHRSFSVFRRVRLNRKLVQGKHDPAGGASYSFLDRRAPRRVGGYGFLLYWLEEVQRDGRRTWRGPIGPVAL